MAVHLVLAPAGIFLQTVGILRMLPGLRHVLQVAQGRGRGHGTQFGKSFRILNHLHVGSEALAHDLVHHDGGGDADVERADMAEHGEGDAGVALGHDLG